MPQLPFDIPKSLASYAEHFDEDPLKATTRLKKQLKKRGPDAVGYFLLAWFYHLKGVNDQAVEAALKAKIYAPGSPFFQKLHYYLSHPRALEAWTPGKIASSQKHPPTPVDKPGPILNLDSLIQKLSEVESDRIRPSDTGEEREEPTSISSDDVDDIVSETLAAIHEKQGNTDAAIRTYKRLKKINAEKRTYYNDQITRLEKQKKEQDEEE